MKSKLSVRRLTLSAMLMAVGMLLPFLTGQIQHIGNMLCPMHLPVFIGGMICGPLWGLALGALLPLVRSMVFGMPVLMPAAAAMAFELAAYGFVSGMLRRKLPRTLPMMFVSLISAMLLGRVVWGLASVPIYGLAGKSFGWQIFVANGFVNAIPGMILQLIAVPAVVTALERAHMAD
ncbi:MAG: ECF transporter S component [Clostridiales bacterium]|nr:ECF transporter S component [Clostridiales bacterium]